MRISFITLVCFFLLSCSGGEGEGIACTAVYTYGITVNLYDTVTGEPITTCDVTYKIVDGEYLEENQFFEGISCENLTYIVGAGERAGVYDVQLTKVGYEVWESTGIIVNADMCHVQPVVLEAFLVP